MRSHPILLIFLFFMACSSSPPLGSKVKLQKNEDLPPLALQDQHGQSISWNSSTRWILFSKEKEVSTKIHTVLEAESPHKKSQVFYVADISAMPSLISRLFALPKMKKYSYSVALDRDGHLTADWPSQPGHATLFVIEDQKIKDILFVKTSEELNKLLQ